MIKIGSTWNMLCKITNKIWSRSTLTCWPSFKSMHWSVTRTLQSSNDKLSWWMEKAYVIWSFWTSSMLGLDRRIGNRHFTIMVRTNCTLHWHTYRRRSTETHYRYLMIHIWDMTENVGGTVRKRVIQTTENWKNNKCPPTQWLSSTVQQIKRARKPQT